MVHKKIICSYVNLQKDISPMLEGTVFHVTTKQALDGIVMAKKILQNSNRHFPFTHSQSMNCFGRMHGYVCLFDWRNVTHDLACNPFYFLADKHDINVFMVLDFNAYGDLIPNHIKRDPYKETCIPKIEVWYPTDISLSKISSILEVQIINKPDNFLLNAIEQAFPDG